METAKWPSALEKLAVPDPCLRGAWAMDMTAAPWPSPGDELRTQPSLWRAVRGPPAAAARSLAGAQAGWCQCVTLQAAPQPERPSCPFTTGQTPALKASLFLVFEFCRPRVSDLRGVAPAHSHRLLSRPEFLLKSVSWLVLPKGAPPPAQREAPGWCVRPGAPVGG